MKKTFVEAIIAGVLLAALCGCTAKQTDIVLDVNTAADALKSAVVFQDEMTELPLQMIGNIYELDEQDFVQAKIYVSTGATAEEIAVFEAKDEKNAAKIYSAAENRISDQIGAFQDYAPKEIAKLESPVLMQEGKYVFLCISNENAKAQETITKIIHK